MPQKHFALPDRFALEAKSKKILEEPYIRPAWTDIRKDDVAISGGDAKFLRSKIVHRNQARNCPRVIILYIPEMQGAQLRYNPEFESFVRDPAVKKFSLSSTLDVPDFHRLSQAIIKKDGADPALVHVVFKDRMYSLRDFLAGTEPAALQAMYESVRKRFERGPLRDRAHIGKPRIVRYLFDSGEFNDGHKVLLQEKDGARLSLENMFRLDSVSLRAMVAMLLPQTS